MLDESLPATEEYAEDDRRRIVRSRSRERSAAHAFPDARGLAVRSLAYGCLLLAASVVFSRTCASTVNASGPQLALEGRLNDIVKHLPDLRREQEHRIVAIGSSLTEYGFSPRQLDAELALTGTRTRSYNFGVPMGNAYVFRMVFDSVAKELASAGPKATTYIIEFAPFFATRATRAAVAPYIHAVESAIASPDVLVDRALEDPVVGTRILSYRFLFGRRNPGRLPEVFELISGSEPRWWFGAEGPPPNPWVEQIRARHLREGGAFQFFRWNPETRGEPNYVADGFDYESFAKWRTTTRFEADFALSDRFFDITHVNVDEELISEFVTICARAKRAAHRNLLVIAPRHPETDQRRSAGGAVRLAETTRRVEQACGIPVLDLNDGTFTAQDFIDPVHLTELSGRRKYTARVADFVSKLL